MEDTLEKPNSPPPVQSHDQSTSPHIPDRALLLEFQSKSKSKGDMYRSMNETFSTVKENAILETDGDNKETGSLNEFSKQIGQNTKVHDQIVEIDQAQALSQELQELHKDVRGSLEKKSFASGAESMLTEEEEKARQLKQFVEIKSSRSKKIDGNESYAVSNRGSVKPISEKYDPPQIADVETNFGNAQEAPKQTTQRAQLTPRQFSRESREPIRGKLLKKRLFDRDKSLNNSNDYNMDLIQVTGQRAALSPQNPVSVRQQNLNKNFIQVQLKPKSPEHVIPNQNSPSPQNQNEQVITLNKPPKKKIPAQKKVSYTSHHLEEPITPISCKTLPVQYNDSNEVTPVGVGRSTVIVYKTNNFKGRTKQTYSKQTNMNLIVKQKSNERSLSPPDKNIVISLKQDNIRQLNVMDKKVNVLMPTQYNSGAIIKPQDPKFHHGNQNFKNAQSLQFQPPTYKLPKSRDVSQNPSRSPSIQKAQYMPIPEDFLGPEGSHQPSFSKNTIFGNKRRTHQNITLAESFKIRGNYKVQSLTIDFNEQQEQTKKMIQHHLAKTQSITDDQLKEEGQRSHGIHKVGHEIPPIAISPGQPKLGALGGQDNVISTTVIGKNSSHAHYEKLGNGQQKLESKQVKKGEDNKTLYSANVNKIEFQAPYKPNKAENMGTIQVSGGDDLQEKRSALRSQGAPNSIQIKLNRRNKIQQNLKTQDQGQPGIYGSGLMKKEPKMISNTKSGSSNPHDFSPADTMKDALAITLPNLMPHPGVSTKSFSKHVSKTKQNASFNRAKREKDRHTLRQNSSDYKDFNIKPMQHKGAFQNSFYNKEVDKLITKQTISKQSLVFSTNNQTDVGGGSPTMKMMPNIDMHHFQMPKIKINNAEASKLMTDSIQSIEHNKKLSLPLSQNTAEFQKTEIGAWSPNIPAEVDQNTNKVYFEQPEQILTNKQNYYYKQIRSLDKKGQQIVISHPYDMSHMANTQKSFLTQHVKQMSRVREAVKTAGNLPKNMRNFNRFSEATPRERKDEWMRKAQIAQETRIINSNDLNLINQAFKGQIKGLPQDHVVPQDQVLQIDKLKMFEKNQDQARSNTVDDEFKSRFRFTPKDAHRTGQDSTPPFPNRQSSPRHTLEDQVSGERRDVVNIHQQLKLKTLPITSKANHQQRKQQDLKASIGLGSYDISKNSSRLRQLSNDPFQNQSRSIDKSSKNVSKIKTARSNQPEFQDQLAQQALNINQKRNSVHNPDQIKIQKQMQTTNEKHNFSFRNVSHKTQDSNQYYMNFQNQRESQKTYEHVRSSNASSPRNTELQQNINQPGSYRDINDSQNGNKGGGRLVAYSSLGKGMAKLSQYKNSSVASVSKISGMSKSPNQRRESQKDNSPSQRSHQSSFNNPSQSGRGQQRSIFFTSPVKLIKQSNKGDIHQQKLDKLQLQQDKKKQDLIIKKNELKQDDSKEYTQEPEMKDNKVQMKEYSIITNNNLENNTHNISLQQSSVNRNQSPTLYTEKIKSLGRKQVCGFAGGVIGSAINPKTYHLRSVKKSEENSLDRERQSIGSQEGFRQQQQEQFNGDKTLSIDSPIPTDQTTRNYRKTLEFGGQKNQTIQVQEIKAFQTPSNQISLSIPSKQDQQAGIKVQLTQRNSTNSQISPNEQQAILMGQASQSDRNQITSYTQRSFKMDDILHELNYQQGSNSSQSHLNQTDKSHRSKKYQQLNVKEIQLQHSARMNANNITSQDYANVLKERQQRDNNNIDLDRETRKRRSQSISHNKNKKSQDQKRNVRIQEELELYHQQNRNSLDPQLVEFLRQKTLYKMQRKLWQAYEEEWIRFKTQNHLNAQAPIPPCCRILTLHIFLNQSQKTLSQMKNDMEFLMADQELFKECFKEGKRRLQMCSFRIIDENVFLDMKHDMTQGYELLLPFHDIKFNHAHSDNKPNQNPYINEEVAEYIVKTLENQFQENNVMEPNPKEKPPTKSSATEYRKKSVMLDATTVHDINEVDEDGADK